MLLLLIVLLLRVNSFPGGSQLQPLNVDPIVNPWIPSLLETGPHTHSNPEAYGSVMAANRVWNKFGKDDATIEDVQQWLDEHPRQGRKTTATEIMAQYDLDKDGVIVFDELVEYFRTKPDEATLVVGKKVQQLQGDELDPKLEKHLSQYPELMQLSTKMRNTLVVQLYPQWLTLSLTRRRHGFSFPKKRILHVCAKKRRIQPQACPESDEELLALADEIDIDHDGMLTFGEFCIMWHRRMAPKPKSSLLETLQSALDYYQYEGLYYSNDAYLADIYGPDLTDCAIKCLMNTNCKIFTHAYGSVCTLFADGVQRLAATADYRWYRYKAPPETPPPETKDLKDRITELLPFCGSNGFYTAPSTYQEYMPRKFRDLLSITKNNIVFSPNTTLSLGIAFGVSLALGSLGVELGIAWRDASQDYRCYYSWSYAVGWVGLGVGGKLTFGYVTYEKNGLTSWDNFQGSTNFGFGAINIPNAFSIEGTFWESRVGPKIREQGPCYDIIDIMMFERECRVVDPLYVIGGCVAIGWSFDWVDLGAFFGLFNIGYGESTTELFPWW